MDKSNLNFDIKYWRKSHDFTMVEAAKALGISYRSYYALEHKQVKLKKCIIHACKYLNITRKRK